MAKKGRHPAWQSRQTCEAEVPEQEKATLKWSDRSMTPVWMREEMKGTSLKKDDFLIQG